MTQSNVSDFEKRADMLLSTMQRFIAATGGELRLVACYLQGDVIIDGIATAGSIAPSEFVPERRAGTDEDENENVRKRPDRRAAVRPDAGEEVAGLAGTS